LGDFEFEEICYDYNIALPRVTAAARTCTVSDVQSHHARSHLIVRGIDFSDRHFSNFCARCADYYLEKPLILCVNNDTFRFYPCVSSNYTRTTLNGARVATRDRTSERVKILPRARGFICRLLSKIARPHGKLLELALALKLNLSS